WRISSELSDGMRARHSLARGAGPAKTRGGRGDAGPRASRRRAAFPDNADRRDALTPIVGRAILRPGPHGEASPDQRRTGGTEMQPRRRGTAEPPAHVSRRNFLEAAAMGLGVAAVGPRVASAQPKGDAKRGGTLVVRSGPIRGIDPHIETWATTLQ